MNGDRKPTTDERLDRLVERHEALAESIELLRGSVHELSATVQAEHDKLRELRQRDRQYFLVLAGLLQSWAGDEEKSE